MRKLQLTVFALLLSTCQAQSSKPSGTVGATLAEFRIPLNRPPNETWIWNRSDTADNDEEYAWTVTAKSGTVQYSFGFYLYKYPGATEARGQLADLLKAGQASVFREDAKGAGKVLPDAKISVRAEDGAIVLRISDPNLLRKIFGNHPQMVDIHSHAPEADYQAIHVAYRQ